MTPDFFIAGSPKCGTTALFHYLTQQPGIFIPAIKEPNYFSDDVDTLSKTTTAGTYESLFASAPVGSLTGEVSAFYLHSRRAIPRIMAANPKARIVVILRHPVEAAHALHTAAWGHGYEEFEDFEDAWRAQGSRPASSIFQYAAIYRYGEQISRLTALVPPAQRQIIIHEEFFSAPASGLAQLLEFLQLPPSSLVDFPRVNEAKTVRWKALHRLLRAPPSWLKALHAPAAPALRHMGIYPLAIARRMNIAARDKPALRPRFRRELEEYFAPDLDLLKKLLGRAPWQNSSEVQNPVAKVEIVQPVRDQHNGRAVG